nr:hypothetical protein [Ramlibacter albus]
MPVSSSIAVMARVSGASGGVVSMTTSWWALCVTVAPSTTCTE